MVDVTVRYENKDYLALAAKEKIEKYRPCLRALKELFNGSGGEILPVVLGSRGAITPNTERILKRLGIADKDIKTILLNVFKKLYRVVQHFYGCEVVCRDRCRRNTPMFNKEFITCNNQRVNNSYNSHL